MTQVAEGHTVTAGRPGGCQGSWKLHVRALQRRQRSKARIGVASQRGINEMLYVDFEGAIVDQDNLSAMLSDCATERD